MGEKTVAAAARLVIQKADQPADMAGEFDVTVDHQYGDNREHPGAVEERIYRRRPPCAGES
jgi:hypothetical protein